MLMRTLPTLLLVPAAALAVPARSGEGAERPAWSASVQPEQPEGYAGNPSTLKKPLRQDLTSLRCQPDGSGRFALELVGPAGSYRVADLDLGLLLPRVPAYARNDDLLRYTLMQREYNRNEVKLGALGDVADFKVANNCLRSGLWELMLDVSTDGGKAMAFHGWFEFPRAAYAQLVEAGCGRPFAEVEGLLAQYPNIDGLAAPLAELRTVTSERPARLGAFADEAPVRFGEQKRKAKLLLNAGIERYADYWRPENQPIRTASFREPGWYDSATPIEFDLSWLAEPRSAVRREVVTRHGAQAAGEVEIAFANGYRLLLADRDLFSLPARETAPENDADTLRLTFGIGTPDIYATLAERTAEAAAERANWLMLLGPDGKHIDNHPRGVDRVFCWNERNERLHLYLVGYERIAVVAHLALDWAGE